MNRWIDSGRLKAYRTPGGHRRVLHADLLRFLDECGIPLPDEVKPTQLSLLLVDDDEQYLKSLRKSLLRLNRALEITTCSSGIEALIQLGAKPPDAIVLDVFMPGLDGVEVCRRIRANPETSHTKIIVSTGHPSPSLEKRVMEAGAHGYMVKPFKASALLEQIRPEAMLAGG